MRSKQRSAPALPLHPQDEMECRRCGVHCDKVVHPGACLSRACPFVYSYEAWGNTYVGCMQKVYEVEIDLDMLRAAEARKPGFGAIRAVRGPRPMWKVEVGRDLRLVRPAARPCLVALQPLDPRGELRDLLLRHIGLRLDGAHRGQLLLQPSDHAVGRVERSLLVEHVDLLGGDRAELRQ